MSDVRKQWAWLYAMIGLFFGAMAWPVVDAALKPRPYVDIHITRADVVGGRLQFIANFRKNDGCDFILLAPVGVILNTATYLSFEDLDGLGTDFNREPGQQTLRISVDLEGGVYDRIEFRTRHDCGGEIINRIFAVVPL